MSFWPFLYLKRPTKKVIEGAINRWGQCVSHSLSIPLSSPPGVVGGYRTRLLSPFLRKCEFSLSNIAITMNGNGVRVDWDYRVTKSSNRVFSCARIPLKNCHPFVSLCSHSVRSVVISKWRPGDGELQFRAGVEVVLLGMWGPQALTLCPLKCRTSMGKTWNWASTRARFSLLSTWHLHGSYLHQSNWIFAVQ